MELVEEEKVEDVSVGTGEVLEEMLDNAGFGWFQIRICLLCAMGYFAVGSELLTMVMTQTGVMAEFDITSSLSFSWLPFCANLASFVAAIAIGKVIDKLGRKWPFILCIAVSAVFALLCSVAPSFPVLTVFRSVVGFGLGGIAVIDYVVLVEVCPSAWRNTACQIVFVSGCLGVIYVALLGMVPWPSIAPTIDTWRCMMFAGGVPLVATVALRAIVSTDTPKFLVTSGKVEEAYRLLETIHRTNSEAKFFRPKSRAVSQAGVSIIEFRTRVVEEQLSVSQSDRGQLSQVLKQAVTVPLAVVWIVQSLVYWGLTTFLPVFLTSAGISPTHGLLAMGLAELPGVVIATALSQYKSRPFALCVCFALSCVGAVTTGVSVSAHWPPAAVVTGACLFYMFLIPIWGILFVLTPETYPVRFRGTAVGFHHMCKSVPSLAAPFIAAAILESGLEGGFMFIWAAVIAVGIAMSVWLIRLHRTSLTDPMIIKSSTV